MIDSRWSDLRADNPDRIFCDRYREKPSDIRRHFARWFELEGEDLHAIDLLQCGIQGRVEVSGETFHFQLSIADRGLMWTDWPDMKGKDIGLLPLHPCQ